MASLGLLEFFLSFVCLTVVLVCFLKNDKFPTNWPVVGMFPELLLHVHPDFKFYEWITELLLKAQCNFLFKGPWFCNMKLLFTADPANIHHIVSSNFSNFHKGSDFKAIFDIFGDGIFNSDSDTWREQRKVAMTLINHQRFRKLLVQTTTDKVQNSLFSVLNDRSEKGSVVDLQDVFHRFTFDSTCKVVIGSDPGCLSTEFLEIPFATAAGDVGRALFYRHILPKMVWKLQRWLGVGEEKKFSRAWQIFDQIIGNYIEETRKEIREHEKLSHHNEERKDLLASYIHLGFNDNRYLRDAILNLLLAGRDTIGSALTLFFWNLSRHPLVEKKIREEITLLAATEEIDSASINKLVYLQAAICESLRLYPPVPWNHKLAIKPDILPSGHHVDPSIQIIFSLYAMGRSPSIWGENVLDFCPDRWITDKGALKHEPSYKFFVFNAGPRTCLGKDMAFMQMKIVAINIIQKFDIKVVMEGEELKLCPSVVLYLKHGLRVKVTKRSPDLR